MDRREAIKRTALLTGYALSASAIQGVLWGCRPEQKSPLTDWKPQFLTNKQGVLAAEMAERILPRTSTPGAQDVFVHEFIDLMVKNCFKPEEKKMFLDGLDEIERECQNANGKPFAKCNPEQQLELLNRIDVDARRSVEGKNIQNSNELPFFLRFKELAILGYFTSEEIGTNVLNYDPIPQKYEGCIPLEEVGRLWALS
jgi:hypothetical protein